MGQIPFGAILGAPLMAAVSAQAAAAQACVDFIKNVGLGRANYRTLGKQLQLGERLLGQPELALDFDVAYRIMSHGMRRGSFMGKKLVDFIGTTGSDYLHARRIINGLDQAAKIEQHARGLEIVLTTSLISPV